MPFQETRRNKQVLIIVRKKKFFLELFVHIFDSVISSLSKEKLITPIIPGIRLEKKKKKDK